MSDLFDDPVPGLNEPEFSVSEMAGAVRRVIEGEFGRVRVRGEVGRVFVARSGHLYFDLKDDRSVLAAVAWKGQVASLTARPEEGMEVVATGRMTTFGSQSKYQLNADDVRPAGVGALMAMLEKRKQALQAEGLFAADRKQPLPFLPEVIGVVTSPSGAVIRDILHRLRERFPRKVLVWPVAVQGKACAPEVAAAIRGFNALTPSGALPRPDLLIVARGGGSIEDLWGFNEEIVARAAADSTIPLISAVGHETDTTLIDHVADRRAPTPTAAAEIAVPVRMELLANVDAQGARLTRATGQAIALRRQRLADLSRALPRPAALTGDAAQRLDRATDRLLRAGADLTAARRARLDRLAAVLRPAVLSGQVSAGVARLSGLAARLGPALGRGQVQARERFDRLAARVSDRRPRQQIDDGTRALAGLASRLAPGMGRIVARLGERLAATDRLRLTLGYEATLARGYAVVHGDDGVVTTRVAAERERRLRIQFRDGTLAMGAGPRRKQSDRDAPDQGDLF